MYVCVCVYVYIMAMAMDRHIPRVKRVDRGLKLGTHGMQGVELRVKKKCNVITLHKMVFPRGGRIPLSRSKGASLCAHGDDQVAVNSLPRGFCD